MHMTYREQREAAHSDPDFWEELLIAKVSALLEDAMEEQGITRSELADRLGIRRSGVTKMLTGDRNMTLRTLARAAFHLGQELQVSRAPKGEAERKVEKSVSVRKAGACVARSDRPTGTGE